MSVTAPMEVNMTTPAAPEDDIGRSAALLEAAGFELVPLRHPLAGVWHLLAVSPSSLLLVSVIRGEAWPEVGVGWAYQPPPAWPPWTRRLIHKWSEVPLPETMPL